MLSRVLRTATARLADHHGPSHLEAQLLLSHILNKPQTWLLAHGDARLDDKTTTEFDRLVGRRINGEPVAYLTGTREFYGLQLKVNTNCMIPRPETELLVDQVLAIYDEKPIQLADLGTGTGAIAIALATNRPQWSITATESNPQTLDVARENAHRHQVNTIDFTLGDWLAALPEDQVYDLIISNPPYIPQDDPHLTQGDLRFEPDRALTPGPTGLEAIEQIASGAKLKLKQDGGLVLEHSYDQQQQVKTVLQAHGYFDITCVQDLAQRPRVTYASR